MIELDIPYVLRKEFVEANRNVLKMKKNMIEENDSYHESDGPTKFFCLNSLKVVPKRFFGMEAVLCEFHDKNDVVGLYILGIFFFYMYCVKYSEVA